MKKRKLDIPEKCSFRTSNTQYKLDYPRTRFHTHEAEIITNKLPEHLKEVMTQTPMNAIFNSVIHKNGPVLVMKHEPADGIYFDSEEEMLIHKRHFRKIEYTNEGYPFYTNNKVSMVVTFDPNGFQIPSGLVETDGEKFPVQLDIIDEKNWLLI